MAHSILNKLKTTSSGNEAVGKYIEDINTKAKETARAEMLVELETAKADIVKVEAKLDAVNTQQGTDVATIKVLKEEIAVLKSSVLNHSTKAAGLKLDLAEAKKVKPNNDYEKEKEKSHKLEMQVSELNGKLSIPKPVVQPIIQPREVPSFKVTPVRNSQGRIESAIIDPIVKH